MLYFQCLTFFSTFFLRISTHDPTILFPSFLFIRFLLFFISIQRDIRNGTTFRKFRWHSICPFFHALRMRTAPAKITHVKVGCINYSERHLSPMACRLDERKKYPSLGRSGSYTRATILTPNTRNYRGRARHFPCAISTPVFRPRAFPKQYCRASITRNITGKKSILDCFKSVVPVA